MIVSAGRGVGGVGGGEEGFSSYRIVAEVSINRKGKSINRMSDLRLELPPY